MTSRLIKLSLAAWLSLSAAALAQSAKNPTVYINGQPIKGTLVTVNGKQMVQLPLTDLQKSGALVSGGSSPVKAIQGCINQPLFNGVVRITLLEAGVKEGKYLIKFKVANGTQKKLLPSSDADASYDNMYAASDDGQVLQFNVPENSSEADTGNIYLTPGANVVEIAVIRNAQPGFKVTRILYRPDEDTLKDGRKDGLPFAPISNMEFALKCK
ncbi:hypothetical protein [Deinococcus marmoris]|uniref:Uncharacterized protein n=1 Tax=Deinococcus marmoris TaxID=249408 RepID=A0A1U7NS19_9DEIO|nr:hypothetical protein [Deinococcus marmoris]OLV15706.1 hypothetical protein BOO71_0014023 [Deinococcus marmoris]